MRIAILFVLFVCASAGAGHPDKKPQRKAVLLDGLGSVHHPVSTKNADAQKFFDQGLRLIYAFNHDEALLAFQRAAELDPDLAMAHWGMALAVGPNYNLDAEVDALKSAYLSIMKAQILAKNAPKHERDYIDALAVRYNGEAKPEKAKLAADYASAMKKLHQAYPDDLDAATLYAESMMNLRPWELWTRDGKPAPGTEEIVSVLEAVLRRNPDHTGANHYYIHAVEASPSPERGLAAAERLGKLAPKAGHLVHMPSHIFARVGDHAASARVNAEAAKVDREYIEKYQIRGVYPMMYYSHNLHFLAVAHSMQGRFTDAKKAGDDLSAHVSPHLKEMPMLEFFTPTSTLVLVRFQRWDDILDLKRPDPKQPIATALWHFARGSAFAATGKDQGLAEEWEAFQKIAKSIPDDLAYSDRNKAKAVLAIPEMLLHATVDMLKGEFKVALQRLNGAVKAEDALNYIEPSDWHLPCREVLGAMLYREKQFAEAEKVFREDLVHNPRNPRSLFGLMECLTAQGNEFAARMVRQEFESAWRHADVKELSLMK